MRIWVKNAQRASEDEILRTLDFKDIVFMLCPPCLKVNVWQLEKGRALLLTEHGPIIRDSATQLSFPSTLRPYGAASKRLGSVALPAIHFNTSRRLWLDNGCEVSLHRSHPCGLRQTSRRIRHDLWRRFACRFRDLQLLRIFFGATLSSCPSFERSICHLLGSIHVRLSKSMYRLSIVKITLFF